MKSLLALGTGIATIWASSAYAQAGSLPAGQSTERQSPAAGENATPAGAADTAASSQAVIGDQQSQGSGSSSGDQDQATSGDAIVVTGTRIPRRGLESAMPVSVVNYEDARSFGYSTIYDALTLNPAIGPGLGNNNSQGEAFDAGVSNINLRNLGVNRSLVLVNGKRWVSSGARTSAVDLNTIPDALIDRIEVVTGGAAAIYGADAVSGAVNIIMKDRFDGLRISATTGISEEGDASQTSITAATGFKFADDRGSFVIGGTYNYGAPLRYDDRFANRSAYVVNGANRGPNDGIPDNIIDNNLRFIQRAGVPTFNVNDQFFALQNGIVSLTGYDRVITPGPLGNGSGGIGAHGFEYHYLRNKFENGSAYAHVGYEVLPDVTWNGTFSYGKSYTRGPTVFPEVRTDFRPVNWWGGTTGEVATLTNPYLPASLRQFMIDRNLTSLPLNRTYLNLPQPFEIHERDTFTIGTDIGGRLTDKLTWSTFFQYGQVVDDVTTTNAPKNVEWLFARDTIADPTTGQPVCANAAARAAGCVPFNYFSTERPSQAFLGYALAERYERRKNELYTAGGSVNGSMFALPYGDVAVALGAEWRRETLSTRDDPDTVKLSRIVFGRGTDYILHPALDEARETSEVFGEVVIPLLRDLPFARRLEIEGAYRYSDYSDTESTDTWKVGARWQPVEDLTLRGVYSRSVRVPNFGELYSPRALQTVGGINDPCSGTFVTQNPNRAANCAAVLPGVAIPLPFPNLNAPTILLGGNRELTPERSDSFTLGAVFEPRFIPGFNLTVDYFDIKIDEIITALPFLSILELCVDSSGGPDDLYCGLISRNPTNGQVNQIVANNNNLSRQVARGVDVAANYRAPLGQGRLGLALSGTYLIEQSLVATPGRAGVDFSGQWNFPRVRANMMVDYTIGNLSFGVNTRFISRSDFSVTDASAETRDPSRVPAYVYNDLTVQFRPTEKYNLTLGVKNISNVGIFGPLRDTQPGPNSSGGAQTGSAYYDAIGRYLFAKVDVRF